VTLHQDKNWSGNSRLYFVSNLQTTHWKLRKRLHCSIKPTQARGGIPCHRDSDFCAWANSTQLQNLNGSLTDSKRWFMAQRGASCKQSPVMWRSANCIMTAIRSGTYPLFSSWNSLLQGWTKSGPRVTWWPATAFSVARGSIQEILQIWNTLQLITTYVSAEASLNRDLLQFPLEGTPFRCTRPFQSGRRAKLIVHPCLAVSNVH